MGRRITRPVQGSKAARVPRPLMIAHDARWPGEARSAVRCSLTLLTLLLVIDTGAGTLTGLRATLWLGLAVLLVVVVWPTRVSAGRGCLVARGVLRAREVHTDRLVSVHWSDGVAQRLVLRDADGDRAEIDPRVLIANPPLWRLVDAGARTSMARGTLCCGETALRQVSARVDRETARTVFKVSGLD